MAYFSLVSLEKTICRILEFDHVRYSISPHEKQQIVSLDKYVVSFQAFLEDFPEKAKSIEARIVDAAAQAEDIIGLFMSEQIRRNFRYTKWISGLRGIKFEFRLQRVRHEMDSIIEEMVEIKNSIIVIHSVEASSSSSPETADFGKIKMVGLSEDLIEIKTRLCGNSPQLQILPIVGMGGIGKTTLARNAYDDQLIMESFHIRAWVTVSQDYSERRIISDLLDSMKEFDTERRNESMERGNEHLAEIPELSNSEMETKVYQTLIGRRFLIVMDDVWSTKVLDYARMLFPDKTNGSRIMLTTRLANVAAYANPFIPFHKMHLMDLDQSWHLLWQKVSAHQEHIPLELAKIGKEIARSCGGLPLAIVVVAGVLSKVSETLTSWEEIARNVKSSLATADGLIEKILSLSYNHLPRHLRPCFLYMGGFPEDHEIRAANLTKLWVAEGFVMKPKGPEDAAEEYLEDLVERSLVVVTKRKSNGRIKSCSLHDMVREMCIKLSEEEKFLVHVTGRRAKKLLRSMKDQRRISISRSNLDSFANVCSSTIRTIMYFQDTLGSLGCLRLLRVLNVLNVRFTSRVIPDQFFELFHLSYLAFCYDEQITRAISNLQNLETLIIKASLYRPLPYAIWNLPRLRHLIVSGCWLGLPSDIPTLALQNLQTLGKVKNLTCSIQMLSLVQNLKKLRLTFFRVQKYFRGSETLLFHNFAHLCRLEKLQLELETNWPNSGNPNLIVPNSLKKLTLIGWGRYEPYINIVGPFPNLEVLKLRRFRFVGRVWTTKDGDFPKLKYLLLDGSDLVHWNTESSHFPRLEFLMIRACWRLHRLPDDIGEIPTLKLVELKLCTKSLAESAREMQEERRSYGDDEFQVRCMDCEDMNEVKELEFSQSLESVRKAKKVLRKPKVSYTKWKMMARGIIPFPKPYFVLDGTEAELKIVDHKNAELQLEPE